MESLERFQSWCRVPWERIHPSRDREGAVYQAFMAPERSGTACFRARLGLYTNSENALMPVGHGGCQDEDVHHRIAHGKQQDGQGHPEGWRSLDGISLHEARADPEG